MKKLIAILSALLVLSAFAFASDIVPKRDVPCHAQPAETPAPAPVEETYWAVDPASSELLGTVSPCEDIPVVSGQTAPLTRLRGILDDGIIRVRGRASITETEDTVTGLAPCVVAEVRIIADQLEFVREIITRRTGGELRPRTIIASTLWRRCDTVSHIFWLDQPVTAVGTVTLSGSVLTIWRGDFDGDGLEELGFKAGIGGGCPTPEPTETPGPTVPPVYLIKPISPCQTPYYVLIMDTWGDQ